MQWDTYTIEADVVEKLSFVRVFDCKDNYNIFHCFLSWIEVCIHVPVCEIKFFRSFEVFSIYWIELIQVVILYIVCWPLRNNLLIGQYSFQLLSEKNMCVEADFGPQGKIVIW